jgi:mannose-6-phosphate isomerase-like protein (cupin superfamily)
LASVLLVNAAAAQTVTRPAQAPAAAPAQADTFRFMAAKDVTALTERPGGGVRTSRLADHDTYFVEYAARTDTNGAEIHVHWTHHMHVLAGEGTLTYGGTVTNPRDTGDGQIRGDGITGGTTISLHEGDYLEIPAGMPHAVNAAHGTTIRYLLFNTRE